jgi:hypothetical protein
MPVPIPVKFGSLDGAGGVQCKDRSLELPRSCWQSCCQVQRWREVEVVATEAVMAEDTAAAMVGDTVAGIMAAAISAVTALVTLTSAAAIMAA